MLNTLVVVVNPALTYILVVTTNLQHLTNLLQPLINLLQHLINLFQHLSNLLSHIANLASTIQRPHPLCHLPAVQHNPSTTIRCSSMVFNHREEN
jgi:hypothetical protein